MSNCLDFFIGGIVKETKTRFQNTTTTTGCIVKRTLVQYTTDTAGEQKAKNFLSVSVKVYSDSSLNSFFFM